MNLGWEIEKTLPPACFVISAPQSFNNGWGYLYKKTLLFMLLGLDATRFFPIL